MLSSSRSGLQTRLLAAFLSLVPCGLAACALGAASDEAGFEADSALHGDATSDAKASGDGSPSEAGKSEGGVSKKDGGALGDGSVALGDGAVSKSDASGAGGACSALNCNPVTGTGCAKGQACTAIENQGYCVAESLVPSTDVSYCSPDLAKGQFCGPNQMCYGTLCFASCEWTGAPGAKKVPGHPDCTGRPGVGSTCTKSGDCLGVCTNSVSP